MANLFPPSIPSRQSPPKAATYLTEAAARAEADAKGIGQPAARLSPRQDVSFPAGIMPHVPTAAVHTGLVSKRYTAPKLGGAYAVTADSSSLQSVAQLEATVSVKSGAEKAPSHALSADSSQQPPAQLGAEVSAESRLRGAESHGLPAGPSRHQPPAQGKPAQREQAQHGLAQREQAHQFARDMLSSRWANAPWADALTAYLCRPDAQHASEHTGLQTNLPGGVAHMAQSEAQHASGKSAQARVSCNPPPLAGGDPKAGDSAVVQRLLHDSADPLSAGAGDWQGPAGTGKPSGVNPIRPTPAGDGPQTSKPAADSSHTPLSPDRGNPQNKKPADDAISRPAVATRIPNALFRSAPQIIKAVPRQVSIPATSRRSRPAPVQLSELGKNGKASFGSAAQQPPAAGSASLSAPLPDSKAATGPVSAALPPCGAAAVGEPLPLTGKAAGEEVTVPLLSPGKAAATGAGAATALLPACKAVAGVAPPPHLPIGKATAAAPGPEAITAPLLSAGEALAGAVPAPLLPTGQAAATAVNAAPVTNGIATTAAMATPLLPAGKAVTAAATAPLLPTDKAAATAPLLPTGKAAATAPLLPTGKAAATAPLLPTGKAAVPSFMRACSKPWGVNKGGRAGGLSKTLGGPRGAKGAKGTGVVQQDKVAKTGEQQPVAIDAAYDLHF